MQTFFKLALMTSSVLFGLSTYAKSPVDISLGIERYQETYREYENGQRFMQQQGYLNGINGAINYHVTDNHAVRLEGRYARGKIDYTGGENPSEEKPQGSPYGSVQQKGAPRRAYDIRSLYSYEKSITPTLSIVGEAGLGYRTLKDLSSRIDSSDYDRKNKTAYAQIGIGTIINLSDRFEFAPKISYQHGIYGRQYSYFDDGTITLKQHNARGLEVELPINQTINQQNKISYVPYYRGLSVPISDSFQRIERDENGNNALATYTEPKNQTHEIGFKLQYVF